MQEGLPPADPKQGNVTYLDQALWRQLADAETDQEFCEAWLALQSRLIGGVSGGVVLLAQEETNSMAPAAVWPRGFEGVRALGPAIERTLRERKGAVLRSDAQGEQAQSPPTGAEGTKAAPLVFYVAFPVLNGEHLAGVAALAIGARPQAQLQTAMRHLQWGVAWLKNRTLKAAAEPVERETRRMGVALDLVAAALEEPRFKGAATVAATEMATRLDCDRASIGFLSRKQVKLAALSHSAQFGERMNLIRGISLAMGESIDQAGVIVWPEPEGRSRVSHAHGQLAREHGDAAICTVPFVDAKGRAYGAITLERSVDRPFDDDEEALCDSVAGLLGPVLEDKRLNDRWLISKVVDATRDQLATLIGPRHIARKLAVVGLLAAALFFYFAHGTYRVTAKTTLEGEVVRVVAAPYRGFVYEAEVRNGDLVEEGQLMARLDTRDLSLEFSRWSSEREQYVVEHRNAMSKGERGTMNVLTKKMKQAEAQLAMLQEQIDRAEISAPFDGVVVSGDLSQSLGAPVDAGEVLFEVAPLDSYRVMMQVDERDIGNVALGQSGDLLLTAMPNEPVDFRIIQVTPVSRTEDGRNYFTVEGRLDEVSERLRPGMEGFAKIEIDRRRLVWIWTHQAWSWLRLKLWTWMP